MKKENLAKIIELRHQLHQHPALSLQEEKEMETAVDLFVQIAAQP